MTRKNMQKKIMCILLSLAMVLTLLPATALAEDGQTGEGGQQEPAKIMPVDNTVNYDIYSEALLDLSEFEENADRMKVNGQGPSLPFNSKITKWYTRFYVRNRTTRYDARFDPSSGMQEERTYIGGAATDFVIEARSKGSTGEWTKQDDLPNTDLKIFTLSYEADRKGFNNVYTIGYAEGKEDKVHAAMDSYEYRLRYAVSQEDGGDKYLYNALKESNSFSINLQYYTAEDVVDFDIDEEEYEDESGQWAQKNEHHFNTVGTQLKMKKIIRPGVLKSVEDKKIYNASDNIYIENEANNMQVYRAEIGNEAKYVKMEPDESPFSIEWDDVNKYYVVTYDKPEKDIYGPEYFLIYEGDYNTKINERYKYSAGTKNNVANFSGLITGKLTVRAGAGDVQDNTINASTENEEINTTEVIFGKDVLNLLHTALKIRTKHGEISFTGDIVDNLKDSTMNANASFEMRDVKTDDHGLTDAQKDKLSSCDVAFDFGVTAGNEKVEFGANGAANITLPFTGNSTGKAVYYLDEEGIRHRVSFTFENGQVHITARHFSTYVVTDEDPEAVEDIEPPVTPGTSGGTGGSATPSDKVTQSGSSTTADLSGSTVSKGGETTTTVNQATADKLVETAVKNNSEEIIIDAVTKNPSAADSAKSAEVILSGDTLKDIAEKTEADVVIRTNVAEVRLDAATVKAAASQAAPGETVSIVAEKVKEAAKEVRFELKIVTGSGKVISDFQGGNVAVTVSVPKSLSGKKLTCVYIDENGYMHRVEGAMNADGTYTFTTGHFSQYALMDEEDAESAIQAQKAEVEAVKLTLRTRLVKMKSGKKAIKLTWKGGEDIHLDGIEIYRSTKRSTGYGKKPLFTTTKTAYYNTAARAGKRYYYKVRGFVTIDGEKVYTRYSTKAWRTVK